MADRWLVDAMHIPYENVRDVFHLYHLGKTEEALSIMKSLDLPKENTSKAAYVWLPVIFEKGRPKIFWHDEWKIEDYN